MSIRSLHTSLKFELIFFDSRNQSHVSVEALDLNIDELDGSMIRCFITFRSSFETYKKIDSRALFNLTPEVRGPIFGGELNPSQDVEIEAKLDPTLILPLSSQVTSIEELAQYLQNLSKHQSRDGILDTESWFAINVKQSISLPPEIGKGQLKVGYSTAWAASDQRYGE